MPRFALKGRTRPRPLCRRLTEDVYWRNPETQSLRSQQSMPQKASSCRAVGWNTSISTSPFSQWVKLMPTGLFTADVGRKGAENRERAYVSI